MHTYINMLLHMQALIYKHASIHACTHVHVKRGKEGLVEDDQGQSFPVPFFQPSPLKLLKSSCSRLDSWRNRTSYLPRQPVLIGGKEIHANHGRTRVITSHEKETSPDQKEQDY